MHRICLIHILTIGCLKHTQLKVLPILQNPFMTHILKLFVGLLTAYHKMMVEL